MPTSVVVRDDTTVTVLATSFALLILGTLFEVPLTTLALGVLAVAIQTWLGSEVYRRIIRKPDPHIDELIGMGFAVGSLTVVIIDQVVVRTPLRDFWWWTLPLVALVLSVRRTRTFVWTPSNFAFLLLAERTMWLCAFGTLLLVQERYWPLWIGIALLAVAICLHKLRTTSDGYSQKWRGIFIAAAIATVGIVWRVIDWRPPNWWIKTADFQFFEALGFSLSHFGAQDQVFAAGEPVKYHWLSYAWTGMLDRVIGAEHWVVITRLGPVVVALTLYFLASTVARHLDLGGRWLALALGLFVLLNDFNFESFSMVFSYVWLLALAALAWDSTSRHSNRLLFVFGLLAAAAFAAKSSNVLIILGLIGVTSYKLVGRRQPGVALKLLLICFTQLLATHWLFFYGSGYSENIGLGVSGFSQDLYGDIDALPNAAFVTVALLLVVNAVVVPLAAISVLWLLQFADTMPNEDERRRWCLAQLIWIFTPTIVTLLLIDAPFHEQEEYFLHSLKIIGTMLAVVALKLAWNGCIPRQQLKMSFLSIAGTAAAVILAHLVPTNEGGNFAIAVRSILGSSTLLIAAFITATGVMLDRIQIRRPSPFTTCLILVVLLSSAVSSNFQWFDRAELFRSEIRSPEHATKYLGSDEVIVASKMLRRLTTPDAVIASNYFCNESRCQPTEYSARRADWTRGGEALILAVYSNRRFLVSGYGFTWQNIKPPTEILNRISWSLSPRVNLQNHQFDVKPDFFLRDLTMPCNCPLLNDLEVAARTPRFALYELPKDISIKSDSLSSTNSALGTRI